MSGLRLRRHEAPPLQKWRFTTSFAELGVPGAICEALEPALGQGPRTMAELAEAIGQRSVEGLRLAGLLLQEVRRGFNRARPAPRPDRLRPGERPPHAAHQRRLGRTQPSRLAVGSGIACNRIKALCCLAPGRGPLDQRASAG